VFRKEEAVLLQAAAGRLEKTVVKRNGEVAKRKGDVDDVLELIKYTDKDFAVELMDRLGVETLLPEGDPEGEVELEPGDYVVVEGEDGWSLAGRKMTIDLGKDGPTIIV
jgi:hypothetical protein